MKKIVSVLAVLFIIQGLSAPALFAQESGDGVAASSEIAMQVSDIPEIKLGFTQRFIFPFLQGDNPLTAGNNITLALTGEVSPISLYALAEAVWTPVAFIELTAGARIVSGWQLEIFGIKGLNGNGLNLVGENNESVYEGSPFDSVIWRLKAGGAFQFDLAAVFPGDWNHVVFKTYHEINYQANSRAKKNQSWFIESDGGENMNGFNYYGNFLLAYQMPLFLNMAGVIAEMNLNLYDAPGRSVWGDDLIRWTFSGVLGFEFAKHWNIMILAQFMTDRNYKESNWKDLHYTKRTFDSLYVRYKRVAAVVTFRF
ncbi:MAG: hypothetical protein FWC17_01245 [Treponema sp.]|nr:hypothetical protein [Treponema sp.]